MRAGVWTTLTVMAFAGLLAACDDDDPTAPDTGSIAVTITTTGAGTDADGFVVDLNEGDVTEDVDVDDEITFDDLEEGDHSVELTDVAANCTVAGDNPRDVTVEVGEEVEVEFEVTCTEA